MKVASTMTKPKVKLFQSSSEFKLINMTVGREIREFFQSSSEFKKVVKDIKDRIECTFNPLLSLREIVFIHRNEEEIIFQSSSEFKNIFISLS